MADEAKYVARQHQSGHLFGPTDSGTEYLAVFYHRHYRTYRFKDKSSWRQDFAPDREFRLFERAEEKGWIDPDAAHWAFSGASPSPIGTRGERLCRIPEASNEDDPRHGYPVLLSEDNDPGPSDDLVQRWIDDGSLEKTWARRIQRRKI